MPAHPDIGIPRPRRRAAGTTASAFALSVRLARLERLAKRDAHIEASLRTLRRALGIAEESV
jgi:hypothetical protein